MSSPEETARRSAEAMRFLAGLLDGSESLPGLEIDTDLRWILLTALASTGYVDRARIEEELARDNTISGQENAAGAIAALPDADAKRESWEKGAVREDVANETQRHIAYVFDIDDVRPVGGADAAPAVRLAALRPDGLVDGGDVAARPANAAFEPAMQ